MLNKKRKPWGCKRIQLEINFSATPPGMPPILAMDKIEKKRGNCFGTVVLTKNSFHEIKQDEIEFFCLDEILGAVTALLKRNSIKLMEVNIVETEL